MMRNQGYGGIDKMSCKQLFPWLLANKDKLGTPTIGCVLPAIRAHSGFTPVRQYA